MGDWVLVVARLGLYLSLGLLAGLPLFRGLALHRWGPLSRLVVAALALAAIVFSALWLAANAAVMGGTPITRPDWAAMLLIIDETSLGVVLKVRLAALFLILLLPPRPALILTPTTIAAATLAWTGHAAATEGILGDVHLASDILHILAASTWLGALASFVHGIFFNHMRAAIGAELAAFAKPGTLIVGMLVVTGSVNLLLIAGVDRIVGIFSSAYGHLLSIKILLFAAMLGLAALNRWLLTPRLNKLPDPEVCNLRFSLVAEISAWIGIAVLIAILGNMDPLAGSYS